MAEPIPENQGWVVEKGEFVCIYTSMVPFIGSDLCFAPDAKLDDGVIWLMIVKGCNAFTFFELNCDWVLLCRASYKSPAYPTSSVNGQRRAH